MLNCYEFCLNFAFKLNMRRYNVDALVALPSAARRNATSRRRLAGEILRRNGSFDKQRRAMPRHDTCIARNSGTSLTFFMKAPNHNRRDGVFVWANGMNGPGYSGPTHNRATRKQTGAQLSFRVDAPLTCGLGSWWPDRRRACTFSPLEVFRPFSCYYRLKETLRKNMLWSSQSFLLH